MPIYGQEVLVICRPYMTDILRYIMQFAIFGKCTQEDSSDILENAAEFETTFRTFRCFYLRLVDNLLNNRSGYEINKIIIVHSILRNIA